MDVRVVRKGSVAPTSCKRVPRQGDLIRTHIPPRWHARSGLSPKPTAADLHGGTAATSRGANGSAAGVPEDIRAGILLRKASAPTMSSESGTLKATVPQYRVGRTVPLAPNVTAASAPTQVLRA